MLNTPPTMKSADADEVLLNNYLAGDIEAFVFLVRRYQDPITNFAFRFLGNYDDAVDVAQETFVRVHRFGKSFDGKVRFTTWLYTIAGNLAKTELQRRRRRHGISLDAAFGEPDSMDEAEVSDTDYMPDSHIDTDIVSREVQRALMTISPVYREMVILRDIQELTYEEIAEITKTELGTVKSRINRGRARLKTKLAALYNEVLLSQDLGTHE